MVMAIYVSFSKKHLSKYVEHLVFLFSPTNMSYNVPNIRQALETFTLEEGWDGISKYWNYSAVSDAIMAIQKVLLRTILVSNIIF